MSPWEIFYQQFITYEGYKMVLNGLWNTLLIAVFGLIVGFIIGSLLAIFRLMPFRNFFAKFLNGFSNVYVAIFRGTPIVVQLLLSHYVLFPAIGLRIPAVIEGIVIFGMNSAAYICEIMRGGILSVDKGQMEAGRALGLGYWRTMFSIVIPQAIKNAVPTLGNEFISLVKETSVAGYIAVTDLTLAFQNIANGSLSYIVPYVVLAIVYLVLVLLITLMVRLIERRLRASDRR